MGKQVAISVTDDVPKKDEVKWGWVVTVAAMCINMVTFGVFKSIGLLYVEFPKAYNTSKEDAAWPGSLMSTVMCLTGPLASVLSFYVTIRTLVICSLLLFAASLCSCYFATTIGQITLLYGGLNGIGMGINYTLLPVLLAQYFEKHKVTSISIFYSGVPIGSVSGSFLVEYLIRTIGLKGTFLVMGCATFCCIFPALFLTPSEHFFKPSKPKISVISLEEINKNSDNNDKKQVEETPKRSIFSVKSFHMFVFKSKMIFRELMSFFKNIPYVLTIISSAAFFNAFVQLNLVLVDTALSRGLSKGDTLYVLMAFNIPDFFGRLIIARISHYHFCRNITIFNILSVILGISMMFIEFAQNLEKFLILAFIFGFTSGQMLPLPVILVSDYLGMDRCAMGFGLANFFNGFLSILRPSVIGLANNVIGKFEAVYYIYGSLLFVAVIIWVVYDIKQKTKKVYLTHL